MRKILMTAALLAFLALPIAARAQTTTTDYSGATSSTSAAPTSVTQNQGSHAQGDTFTVESCGFSDGVALQFNGNDAGSDTLNAAGCASESVTILEDGAALGTARFAAVGLQLAAPTPQISIDGKVFTAKAGSNTLAVFGVGTNGADRTVNNIITIAGSTSSGGNG